MITPPSATTQYVFQKQVLVQVYIFKKKCKKLSRDV